MGVPMRGCRTRARSRCRPWPQSPMGKQVWIAALECPQPIPSRHDVTLEPFVFASRPSHDEGVDRAEFLAKLRGVETAVVAHPACQDRANPFGDFLQRQIVAAMQSPTSHALPHSLAGRLADRRDEPDKALAVTVLRHSRPKRVAEKIE